MVKELSFLLLGRSSVPNMWSKVVFPAPEGPTIATISLSSISMLIFFFLTKLP